MFSNYHNFQINIKQNSFQIVYMILSLTLKKSARKTLCFSKEIQNAAILMNYGIINENSKYMWKWVSCIFLNVGKLF